jgi:hypothetical protein
MNISWIGVYMTIMSSGSVIMQCWYLHNYFWSKLIKGLDKFYIIQFSICLYAYVTVTYALTLSFVSQDGRVINAIGAPKLQHVLMAHSKLNSPSN